MQVVELIEEQLAYHIDLDNLRPGTGYQFSYKLKKENGDLLEQRNDGAFRTFETDPDVFKFSASSCAVS